MTIILALAHAFSGNPEFNPFWLYLATFCLDYLLIFVFAAVLGR